MTAKPLTLIYIEVFEVVEESWRFFRIFHHRDGESNKMKVKYYVEGMERQRDQSVGTELGQQSYKHEKQSTPTRKPNLGVR